MGDSKTPALSTLAGVALLGTLTMYAFADRMSWPPYAARRREERLFNALSHELRTPLTALLGRLETTLLRRRSPEHYEDVLWQAVEDASFISDLLDEILTLTPIASGASTPLVVALDLRDTAVDALAAMQGRALGKNQTLTMLESAPASVQGNTLFLRRVVDALLDNAVTYTPPGGEIALQTGRDAATVSLSVRDDGPGIAPHHLPYLFEPLYRVDPSRTVVDGGRHPGLGLSRAARIARAHRGRLSVQSRVAQGSTFTLTLPHAVPASDDTSAR